MKRSRVIGVAAFVAVAAVVVAPSLISYLRDRPVRDPIQYWLLWDDTLYARLYSEQRFARVKPEMSDLDVRELLGPPLKVVHQHEGRIVKAVVTQEGHSVETFPDLPASSAAKPTEFVYFYSQAGSDSDHWFVRAVVFDSTRTVKSVSRTFYAD